MKHIGTQTIETERLYLRRFTVDDAQDMYRNWACDPEVTKYLRWQPHESVEETAGLLRIWTGQYENLNYYHWAIALKENNMAIGSIGILEVSDLDESGEIGYCLGREWWGKGLMTEAARGVISFGFNQIGLNRLEAFHSVNNPASGRVMQKAGMLFEGMARQKYKCGLGFQDCNMYSILKDSV